jgi:hypothetical protein
MWFFWIFSLVPILAGLIFLWKNKNVCWQEWLGSAGISLLLAGIFQLVATIGMTGDVETWSGLITQTTHYGRWVEEYQQMHTRQVPSGTDKDGNTTYTTEIYYTTEHATHRERWDADRDFGAERDDVSVDQSFHLEVKQNFGGGTDSTGQQRCTHGGHYDGGDRNYYVTINKTAYKYPVTKTKSFENKIKASPSLFSFVKVPTNVAVYPWPKNSDWLSSERVLGTAQKMISTREWDILNADLGPTKKINLIVVGFPPGSSSEMAKWQEASWIGGKKNDLVICYGGGSKTQPAEWATVFGWTEQNIVKLNIQDIFTGNPINNSILPKIKDEVKQNYVKKDWHKFDYLTVEPPTWSYWVYLMVMLSTQIGLYIWFHVNEYNGTNSEYDTYYPIYRGMRYSPPRKKSFSEKCYSVWVNFVSVLSKFFIR